MSSPRAAPPLSTLDRRSRYGAVLGISLPIVAALSSQNLLNLVDTWIVGQLGSLELACAALGGTTNWVISSFFMGLGAGVQALVSRRVGEGSASGAINALNRSLIFIAKAVTPLAVLAVLFSEPLLSITTGRGDVLLLGTPYLAIRLAGLPFTAANFSFRGYWNGMGLSALYMRTLIGIHVLNVIMTYGLVFGVAGLPAMGVFGAGVGTTFAQAIGTIYYCYLARRHGGAGERFLRRGDAVSLRRLLRLGAPAGLQTLFFSSGFLVFFAITDKLGAQELGASHVLVTMALLSILPAVGFGLGAASLVGQALGAQRPDDAKRWGWLAVGLGCGLVAVIGGAEVLWAPWWMHSFIPNDPAAAELAIPALRIIGAVMVVDCVGVILSNTLIGVGATRLVMYWSVSTQYGIFLPLAWYLGLHLGLGLTALWATFALYRTIFAIAMVVLWSAGRWQTIEV